MITIYHNPRCSKSRAALAYLQEHTDETVRVVRYLDTPPTAAELTDILRHAGLSPRQALRPDAGVDESFTDAEVISAMVENPSIIERPLVITPKGGVIARPTEKIGEIL